MPFERIFNISRFVNHMTEESLRGESEAFLFRVFESLQVKKVVRLGVGYAIHQAIQQIVDQMIIQHKNAQTISDLLKYISENDLTMIISGNDKTFGINFQANQSINSHGCSLFYRPGALSSIYLRGLYFSDQLSPSAWAEGLASSEAVHVVCVMTPFLRRQSRYGEGDKHYLLWKSAWLSNRFKESKMAVEAGLQLRDLSRVVWIKRRKELARLEAPKLWNCARKQLLKSFDNALLEEVGNEKLSKIFKSMGTTLDQWCSV